MDLERNFSLEVYPRRKIVVHHAKDALIWDIEGKEYIDCAAGIGVANIGHCNDYVVSAVKAQAERLITCPGIFFNDTRARFLEKLVSIAPRSLNKVFLCNSGTETIEAAIKFARFTTGRSEFVCANRGFHGRTLGSLSATYEEKYREGFQPLVPGFHHAAFNSIDRFKDEVNEDTAGIILEPIQGEGGINIGTMEFFQQVRSLCDRESIILILDEVQTGFCRTGTFFAFEQLGIEPDVLCLAKSIAGGIPMGAVLCSNKIKIDVNKHGSTFGGNPLACAAGVAAIDFMIENNLSNQSREKGHYLMSLLQKTPLPIIRQVRGKGLMIGIELKRRVSEYLSVLLDRGIIALPAGKTVLRLLPPLTISYKQLEEVARVIIDVLQTDLQKVSNTTETE